MHEHVVVRLAVVAENAQELRLDVDPVGLLAERESHFCRGLAFSNAVNKHLANGDVWSIR